MAGRLIRQVMFLVALAVQPWIPAVRAQQDLCDQLTWAELKGDLDPRNHAGFEPLPQHLSTKNDLYLRTEVLDSLLRMTEAARSAGITLSVISATRDWNHQRRIWNGKWASPRFMGFEPLERAASILEFSSMPGSSRHHWGTDVDLNALENAYFEHGEGALVYRWLFEHAHTFGFVQVYGDQRNGRTGYREEKWHWSFWPLAEPLLHCYVRLRPADAFSGFQGAELSDSLRIFEEYVLGIDGPDGRPFILSESPRITW